MRELPFAVVDVVLDAGAGVAFVAVEATLLCSLLSFDGPRLALLRSGFDLIGDSVAIADVDLSGRFLAELFARLCSAISSFNVDLLDGMPGLVAIEAL